MNEVVISIANEYTKAPGGRFKKEGPHSGEDFREARLKPRFLQAKSNGDILVVDLDGGYGYATSFLEEAFGGLARDLKDKDLLKIKIISNEEPALKRKIQEYIEAGLKN
ncbi:MAG: STAS-like domain-containing protein [Christensenellaceae bacterium]